MDQFLLFALLGLGSGALISGVALGVVLTYRGSGVINLATGAVAMVAGYAFWSLDTGHFGFALATPAAVVVALAVAVAMGVLVEIVAFRPLRTASPVGKLAASLGVLLAAQAAILLGFGTSPRPIPSILPDDSVTVFGVVSPVDRFILTGIVLALAAALALAYRFTRFGLATRAAAENEKAAVLAGLSADQLSITNTALASLVVGALGVLAAPLVQLDSSALPLQVIPALAAALFARFTSFGIACAAGLLIGVAQSLMYYASTQSWFPSDHGSALPGVQPLLVFLIIVVAMFTSGARMPGRGELVDKRLPVVPLPHRLARTTAVAVGIGAVSLVVLPFDFRQALTNSLISAVVLMSYTVITGYAGQISVLQLALSGVAGFSLANLANKAGIGFPLGPLIAIVGATALGLLMAVSALRVRGVSLAVVTLAGAMALEQFFFANATWGGGAGVEVASPHLFGLNLGPDTAFQGLDGKQPSALFGLGVLAVTALVGAYVANLRRTSLGRRMIAVRANERAAAAAGISVRGVKLAAFGISSFIAGVAGVLFAYNYGSVSSTRYGALTALGLIGFAYIGGVTMVSGAVIGGLISTQALVPHALEDWFGVSGTWSLLVGGLALVAVLIAHPEGVAGASYQRRRRRRSARERPAAVTPSATGVSERELETAS